MIRFSTFLNFQMVNESEEHPLWNLRDFPEETIWQISDRVQKLLNISSRALNERYVSGAATEQEFRDIKRKTFTKENFPILGMGKLGRPFIWENKEYKNIEDALNNVHNISVRELITRIRLGRKSEVEYDKNVVNKNYKDFTWNGKEYNSIKQAARDTNISDTAMYNRISRGYETEDEYQESGAGNYQSKVYAKRTNSQDVEDYSI